MVLDWVREQERELIRSEARFDARGVQRRAAVLGGFGELVTPSGIETRWVDQRPRAHRDDVGSRVEKPQVVPNGRGVLLGTTRCVHDAVRTEPEQRFEVVGGRQADRFGAREHAGVLAHLLRRVHPDADQLHVGPPLHGADGDRTDPPGRPDDDSLGRGFHGRTSRALRRE